LSRFPAHACSLLARGSDVGAGLARSVWADWSRPVNRAIRRQLRSVIAIGRSLAAGLFPVWQLPAAMEPGPSGSLNQRRRDWHYPQAVSCRARASPEPGRSRSRGDRRRHPTRPAQVRRRYTNGISSR